MALLGPDLNVIRPGPNAVAVAMRQRAASARDGSGCATPAVGDADGFSSLKSSNEVWTRSFEIEPFEDVASTEEAFLSHCAGWWPSAGF
jgi:hypothetical protein